MERHARRHGVGLTFAALIDTTGEEQTLAARVKRILKRNPFVWYFSKWFIEIITRVDALSNRIGDVERRLDTDLQTAAELLLTTERRIAEIDDRMVRFLLDAGDSGDPALVERGLASVGHQLAELRPGTAAFLNWAQGHEGFAAQAGVWLNWPASLEHRAGQVTVGSVNERVVELPFALGAAARLAPASHVLDVGSTESLLPIHLASLGHEVVTLDPRPYPLRHPRLTAVTDRVDTWPGPGRPLDAIFCISTLEHLGVGGAYGQAEAGRADVQAMRRFREWLKPGGTLLLSVPYGKAAEDSLQRVYDDAMLAPLLEGWSVKEKRVYRRADATTWEPVEGAAAPGDEGVVTLELEPVPPG